MKCAKCPGELETVQVGEVQVDRCPGCQGVWFDRRELRRVLDAYAAGGPIPLSVPSEQVAGHDDKGGSCPRCKVALEHSDTLAAPNLYWDTCSRCGGAWLDGGELTAIAADPDAAAAAGFFSS